MKREFREIQLSDIVLSKDNKRKIDEKSQAFEDLKASIAAGGVRLPVQVRVHPQKEGWYELRYGERRYRASKSLGLKTIPAIVTDSMSEEDAIDLTYIENKFREDLKPLEEAAEVAQLIERMGGDAKKVAERIGKDRQWVYVRANIAKGLIKEWRKAIDDGPDFKDWSLSHLLLIARLPEHIQKALLEEVSMFHRAERMSASELEEKIGSVLHLLSKAKWELEDETLVPKAGACTKCPKRSGHQPMLWFDSDDQVDAGDQCLDGLCWKAKSMAWLQRRAKELKEKHPDMVFIAKDYPKQQEAESIGEAVGPYLSQWDYKSASKSTKGAIPAMHVQGKAAGQLTYIKVDAQRSQKSGARPKGTPTPLKERRQALDAKRWSQTLLDMREKVKAATINDITCPDKVTAVMALAAAYGNKKLLVTWYRGYDGDEKPKTNSKEITKLIKSKTPLSQARALELLWESFLPTIDDLLTYSGPITQTPWEHQENAKWIAELINVDIKMLFEDVSQRKGFTEPKSWAGLNADGTPKKAKPAKAKSQKEKPKKTKAKAERQKGICRICGCSDENACIDQETGEPCHWVEDDLCSACERNLIAAKKTA